MDIPVGLKRVVVLCVLRSKAGLLLLCRSEEPLVGMYVPVGGHLEPYETPKSAVIREVKEETGITIQDATLRGFLTETSPSTYNWMCYVYSADVDAISPPECKEGKLKWISLDSIKDIPTPLTDRFMYDYIAKSEFFVLDSIYNEKLELLKLVDELSGEVLFEK